MHAATRNALARMGTMPSPTPPRVVLFKRGSQSFQGPGGFFGELLVPHALLTSDARHPRFASICARHLPTCTERSATGGG